jgi:hypothetical protein
VLRLPGLGNNNEKLGLPERLSAGVIWYFEPHGKLNPGSIYIHGILNPLLKIEPLLYGKLNPHGILNPPISNQKICSEVKI